MAAKIDVKLDRQNQIICFRLDGDLDIHDVEEVNRRMDAEVMKLKNPDDIRILVDSRASGKSTASARKGFLEGLKKPSVKKHALWGIPAYQRIFLSFLFRASGLENTRFFKTEEKARQWLVSGKD